MDRVLLDTDVIIENFKGNETILSKIKDLKDEKALFYISPVSIAEVYAGIRSKEEEMVYEFSKSLSCLLIDQTIAVKAGEYLCHEQSRSSKGCAGELREIVEPNSRPISEVRA